MDTALDRVTQFDESAYQFDQLVDGFSLVQRITRIWISPNNPEQSRPTLTRTTATGQLYGGATAFINQVEAYIYPLGGVSL